MHGLLVQARSTYKPDYYLAWNLMIYNPKRTLKIQGVSKKCIPQLWTINSLFFNACQKRFLRWLLSSEGFVQYYDLIYHWTERFLILKRVWKIYIENSIAQLEMITVNCVADFHGTKSYQSNVCLLYTSPSPRD